MTTDIQPNLAESLLGLFAKAERSNPCRNVHCGTCGARPYKDAIRSWAVHYASPADIRGHDTLLRAVAQLDHHAVQLYTADVGVVLSVLRLVPQASAADYRIPPILVGTAAADVIESWRRRAAEDEARTRASQRRAFEVASLFAEERARSAPRIVYSRLMRERQKLLNDLRRAREIERLRSLDMASRLEELTTRRSLAVEAVPTGLWPKSADELAVTSTAAVVATLDLIGPRTGNRWRTLRQLIVHELRRRRSPSPASDTTVVGHVGNDDLDPRWFNASITIDTWHFHQRLWERYSIVLAPGDFSGMQRAIRDGAAALVQRRGKDSLWRVEVRSLGCFVYVLEAKGFMRTAWPARYSEARSGGWPLERGRLSS